MLFNSFTFLLVFLPTVVLLYWLAPRGLPRIAYLVLASCLFYGLWDWRYLPLLLGTTLVDWAAGHAIARSEAGRRRKALLAAAIAVNVGLLAYFKYRGFFFSSLDGLFRLLGAGEPLPALKVLLPVGVSFYTFAGISYVVDVYRGTVKPARSVLHFLAWATLFPYLMAGPIIRYGHVGEQIERAQQRFRLSLIGTGLFFLVLGLAKKMLVADTMAPYVNDLFARHADLSLLSGWGAALGYTMQLYFDFSGYSDMAVGVGFFLGLRLPQNFDSPYKAVNVSDFWRRWHMTLSLWMRDYLFIPLGGSRGTQLLTVRNLLITFLLGGLWHGAAWTFVIWGLLWGIYLSVHSTLRKHGLTPKWIWLNRIITFVCATVAWVFFRASSLRAALDVLVAMTGLRGTHGAGLAPLPPALAALILGALL
ncbi:MAG: MBOAT family O-acyltransferase, partial [Thermoleophilia bacterium]